MAFMPGARLMTWTKLGDEFPAEARKLTDAEFRTHVEALAWSNDRLLDLLIPKADVRRFAETADPDLAVKGLVAKGWWEDQGDCWYVGLHNPEWQLERAVVKQRQEANALRVRRSRMHKAGDHSICVAGNCPAATPDVMHYGTRDVMSDPGRDGSGPSDPPSVPKSKSLSEAGALHAALSAVVPDATERETELIRDMIGQRQGVRAANAVMRREIADGNGPALVAAVRGVTVPAARSDPDARPSAVAYADLYQGRECDHGDPRGASMCALCRRARASPAA